MYLMTVCWSGGSGTPMARASPRHVTGSPATFWSQPAECCSRCVIVIDSRRMSPSGGGRYSRSRPCGPNTFASRHSRPSSCSFMMPMAVTTLDTLPMRKSDHGVTRPRSPALP
ncbi:hypothetical protein NP493_225g01013 [Ridgeia piscesae]|uniref:Uncharacterized protein n=1 Tax=Ridgeia piscesae TaxID=27915 RepID=A0AAD9P095_RIDPI|nr:hypothetical protein NP493_225g01013 [Ridgeia piscesae]